MSTYSWEDGPYTCTLLTTAPEAALPRLLRAYADRVERESAEHMRAAAANAAGWSPRLKRTREYALEWIAPDGSVHDQLPAAIWPGAS